MALVMFRCFECEFISSSIEDVRIHIKLEHEGEDNYSDSNKGRNLAEISSRSQSGDLSCVASQESLHGSMKWTRDMVLFLIECFKKHEDNFHKAGYTSKQVWNHIAKDFSKKYFSVSGESCNEKWRNLKRTYRNIKNNLQRAGSGRMKFLFFEEMDNIFSKRPEINHPITISTTRSISENEPVIRKEMNAAIQSTIGKGVGIATNSIPPSKNRKRHALPHCCAHFLVEMKKLEDAKEVSEQRRHEEKMALLRELIGIKKQKLNMLQKLN